MGIRSTAKAIIIHRDKILINKCYDKHNGEYFSLPGGGQNVYETLYDAVIRECLEETGYTVLPVRFAALCELICEDKEFRKERPDYAHKMYHIFVCNLADETIKTPTEMDAMQTESVWIEKSQLNHIRVLPKVVGDNMLKIINSDFSLFLGSEHIQFNNG